MTMTMEATNGAALVAQPRQDTGNGSIAAFSSSGNFEAAQRMAKALTSSSLVPKEYQNNLPNVLIAMELASRIGTSVFAAMQSLDIIHGRPSWRSTFLIATVNSCGRFSPLRYEEVGQPGTDSWGFRAIAKDRTDGEPCIGPEVTMGMAKAEGWATRNGNKYRTMPGLMLRYRAAAFWTRLFAPELSLGMHTQEEIEDVYGGSPVRSLSGVVTNALPERGSPQDLKDALLGTRAVTPEAPSSAPEVEAEPVAPASEPRRPEDADSPPPDDVVTGGEG
jgi:hypothetical protein